MFDSVMVLGLDVAEDVSDDGAEDGEHDAGNDDCCEDHGSLRSRAGGFRAPPEKPPVSWVLRLVSSLRGVVMRRFLLSCPLR